MDLIASPHPTHNAWLLKSALWLGHESPSTTHHYVEADLAMKDRALERLQEPDEKIHRYHAPDSLLAFLKTL